MVFHGILVLKDLFSVHLKIRPYATGMAAYVFILMKMLIFGNRDIKASTKEKKELDPLRVFTGHSAWVEDVAWHEMNETVFGSVGDDKKLLMYGTPSTF